MDFEQSPEQENNDLGVNENTQGSETSTEQPDLTDLDSVDRFRFAGREWTRDELQKSILMQNDYTRKTQEISETRKYYEHLQSDLPKVLRDPSLVAEFKKVYPKEFHSYVGHLEKQQAAQQSGIDPKLMERLERLEGLEKRFEEQSNSAADATLDSIQSEMQKKYPLATERLVLAEAKYLMDSGKKVDAKALEGIWKQTHEYVQKIASQSVKSQKQANLSSKDMGAGGAIPAQGSKQAKTIKEASELFRQRVGLN